MLERKYFYSKKINQKTQDGYIKEIIERQETTPEHANLVSSELTYYKKGSLHAPALDLDLPCKFYPSRTKGHYHLLIDLPMPWRTYKRLLRALYKAGIIEKGFYKVAAKRKATYLRTQTHEDNTENNVAQPQPLTTWQ